MTRRFRPGRRTGAALLSLAVLFGAGCAALVTKERELVFRPARDISGWFSGLPADVREFYMPVSDQPGAERLHSWYWPADSAGAPTLLYLHGVRWNLTAHLRRIENLRSFGFSVVAIDYRGFGQSDGEMPSEEGVYDDAAVAWRWLVAQEPDPKKRFIYGHSLGTAVATELAVSKGAADGMGGLILEGGFTSLPEMAQALAPSWLPVDWLVTQKFATLEKIPNVSAPGAVVHGTGDRMVPHRFSEALYRPRAQSQEARARRGRQPLQHVVGRRRRVPRGDRRAVRAAAPAGRTAAAGRREARLGRDRRASVPQGVGTCLTPRGRQGSWIFPPGMPPPGRPPSPPRPPPPACGITRPVCCWRRRSAISFIVRSSAVFAAGP